ncbi:MAG: hypothetical protein ABI405_12080 [Parafilimonas sp.]
MHRNRNKFFIGIPLIIIAGILLISFIVMQLWNAILPSVLNVHPITYWQAVGILILSKILFGSFGRRNFSSREKGWPRGMHWRQKWMNMSDEERAKFREGWKNRCRRPDENKAGQE